MAKKKQAKITVKTFEKAGVKEGSKLEVILQNSDKMWGHFNIGEPENTHTLTSHPIENPKRLTGYVEAVNYAGLKQLALSMGYDPETKRFLDMGMYIEYSDIKSFKILK